MSKKSTEERLSAFEMWGQSLCADLDELRQELRSMKRELFDAGGRLIDEVAWLRQHEADLEVAYKSACEDRTSAKENRVKQDKLIVDLQVKALKSTVELNALEKTTSNLHRVIDERDRRIVELEDQASRLAVENKNLKEACAREYWLNDKLTRDVKRGMETFDKIDQMAHDYMGGWPPLSERGLISLFPRLQNAEGFITAIRGAARDAIATHKSNHISTLSVSSG